AWWVVRSEGVSVVEVAVGRGTVAARKAASTIPTADPSVERCGPVVAQRIAGGHAISDVPAEPRLERPGHLGQGSGQRALREGAVAVELTARAGLPLEDRLDLGRGGMDHHLDAGHTVRAAADKRLPGRVGEWT